MRTAEFDYELPPGLIAQEPASERDDSRLLVLDRASKAIEHHRFPTILDFLNPGDVLVLNNSRVIPARLRGQNARTGGRFEILLFQEVSVNDWWVMVRPGKRALPGTVIEFHARDGTAASLRAEVTDTNEAGHRRLQFEVDQNILELIDIYGEMPLPPYINRAEAGPSAEDSRRYQTVYAQTPGSVAAPTAGLHFTSQLLEKIREKGVGVEFVTLHVGLGTFTPVKAELVSEHRMHEEVFTLPAAAVSAIERAKAAGRKVVSVGTTTVRVLESVARANGGRLQPGAGATSIFIYPPSSFQVVDALLTNFHLPRSTLLMLVSAFASPGSTDGIALAREAYSEAVRERYRFFSYGDAMLIK